MSTYMGRELELLVQSMICGALLVLVYDGIRIFRIIGKRVKSLDTAVDILFWSAAGLFLFFMCLRENGGSVRCYLLCGILLGAGVWYWGIGKSVSGMEFLESSLPGFNSELILTSVMACFGILPGILTVLIYLMMIWKIFGVSKKQQNQLGTMIGYGCGLVFATQVAYSILTYLRVLRISSVILPFLSVTGGGTLVAYLLMGMVLSVCRYKNIPLHPEKSRLPRIRITIE